MKMRPTVNSDEFASANRSAHVARYASTDHSSRRPKEQISATKNAQTEYAAHLSQNPGYSSTYGPSDQQTIRHVNNVEEGRRDVTRNHEKAEQNHKGVDTRDIDSLRRHRSKKSCCIELRLFCRRLCRTKKKYSRCVLRKPRRLLERIKARSKECLLPDDAAVVAGPSTAPYPESISYRDAPKKSRERRHKRDEPVEEIADKDVSEDVREERKERRKRAKEERKKEEKRETRERREREEHAPHPVDPHLIARDDDLAVVDDRVPVKRTLLPPPPPSIVTDFTKTCCYLCAQNTLAIATAATVSRPEQSDKGVQVSPHKFHAETFYPTLDKSSSPVLLVRTVQSSVKVKTRETGTMWCPSTTAAVPREEGTGPRVKKRKKFLVFPGLTRTKCPAGRHAAAAACETDKSAVRRDNAEKRERCCREKNAT